MIIDAQVLEAGATLEADLCIVGGGLAGVALARELIGAPLSVCLLESGGWRPAPETQSLDAGDNIGQPYFPLDAARVRVLGGSSALWHIPLDDGGVGARIRPLDPIDFEPREWVPYSGWPFGHRCLEPYYQRAQQVCETLPCSFEPGAWGDAPARSELPLERSDAQTILYKFCRRELFTETYPKEVGSAENIRTCLHATVVEIETGETADHVVGLRVVSPGGTEFSVRARAYVLAAGGIETPRLLLSSSRRQPAGLGNGHDLVGRFFMEHLHLWSGMLVPETPDVFARTALYNGIHSVDDVAIVGKLALRDRVLRRERLLNQNIQLMPCLRVDPFEYPPPSPAALEAARALLRGASRSVGEDLRTAAGGWRDVAAAAFRRLRTLVADLPTKPVFVFAHMAEQRPHPASRVTLGDSVDRFGMRRVQLDWRISPDDVRSIARTETLVGTELQRLGYGRFHPELAGDEPPATTHGGYHHMGTTRMHADPTQGVVDADCRLHGVDNLYVAGPSVFPTGGYANPVLTMLALTLRLADLLKTRVATCQL